MLPIEDNSSLQMILCMSVAVYHSVVILVEKMISMLCKTCKVPDLKSHKATKPMDSMSIKQLLVFLYATVESSHKIFVSLKGVHWHAVPLPLLEDFEKCLASIEIIPETAGVAKID